MARLKRFAPLLLLLAGAVAVFASGAGQYLNLDALQSHEAALRAFVAQQLPLALLAFIAVYALATTVSLPGGTILTLAGGFLFGTWVGGAATVVGATLGAILVFYAVKTSFGQALTRLGHPSVAVYDGSMSEWTRDPDLPMETGT